MHSHIIATCGTRLAIDDARKLGKLPRERREQLLVAEIPLLGSHNASAMGADVAGEGSFDSSRFLRSCKVHRNFGAVALLDPSVGKRPGVTHRWSVSIHGVYARLREAAPPLRYFRLLGLLSLCLNSGSGQCVKARIYHAGKYLIKGGNVDQRLATFRAGVYPSPRDRPAPRGLAGSCPALASAEIAGPRPATGLCEG